jgi:hypothetical protein
MFIMVDKPVEYLPTAQGRTLYHRVSESVSHLLRSIFIMLMPVYFPVTYRNKNLLHSDFVLILLSAL